MEDSVRYVPTVPSAPTDLGPIAAVAVRNAVHDLRVETERRAWATRPPRDRAFPTPALPVAGASTRGRPDPLVALLAQLQAVTTRYVRGLRAGGARPEQMVVQVKTFVRDAMLAEGWADPDATRALTAEVVRWGIDAYYDT